EEKRWFAHPGWPVRADTWGHAKDADRRRAVEVGVWEALDTDREFDDENCVRVALRPDDEDVTMEEQVEAVVAVFLRWLAGLRDGVIPATFWTEVVAAGGDSKAAEEVLDRLPEQGGQTHAIVFVNLMGFIQELLEILVNKQEGDKKKQMAAILERILEPLTAVLVKRPESIATKISYKEETASRAWVRRFIEM
ncbi:hypothetical protein BZA05DRAFT_334439, partial [Tricharina praecox]|uniref:uncharacterized protein n=1 Tax=Tricharina praecox TaxID=43433 RepID=UPI00221ED9EE